MVAVTVCGAHAGVVGTASDLVGEAVDDVATLWVTTGGATLEDVRADVFTETLLLLGFTTFTDVDDVTGLASVDVDTLGTVDVEGFAMVDVESLAVVAGLLEGSAAPDPDTEHPGARSCAFAGPGPSVTATHPGYKFVAMSCSVTGVK